jgi:WD40 repeat protein
VWAASLPTEHTASSGCGNTWIPLTAIKCGTQEIACLEVAHKNSVVAVGDVAGNVSLWQIPESASSGFSRLFSALLDSRVTSLCLSADGAVLVAGTEDGTLYESHDWGASAMTKIESLNHIGASGAIMKAFVAPYWTRAAYTSAIYVIYKSGHYAVVDLHTHQLLSFCSSGSNPIDLSEGDASASDDDDDSYEGVRSVDNDQLVYACVMRGDFEIVTEMPKLADVKDEEDEEESITTPVKEEVVSSAHTTPELKKGGGGGGGLRLL